MAYFAFIVCVQFNSCSAQAFLIAYDVSILSRAHISASMVRRAFIVFWCPFEVYRR